MGLCSLNFNSNALFINICVLLENKFRQTFEKMEGFSFVTPVTGLNRPNTGKEDDDDDVFYPFPFHGQTIVVISLLILLTHFASQLLLLRFSF
jgi:hypothetical protein